MKHITIDCPIPPFSPRQGCWFVMSSRRKHASVTEIHINRADADRSARRLGTCVRFGYLQNGTAECV